LIKNTGNTIITVGLNLIGEGDLPAGWDAQIIDSPITRNEITQMSNIAPSSIVNYYVEVNTDIDDDTGDYGNITCQAEIVGASTGTVTNENLTLNTTVGSSRTAPTWVVSGEDSASIEAGEEIMFTVDLHNDNNVDMNTIITVNSIVDALGMAMDGWDVAIYDDSGDTPLVYDEEDELVAEPLSPSIQFELPADDSNRYFVVVTTTSDADTGSADINIYATFLSLARDNSELELEGNATTNVTTGADDSTTADEDFFMSFSFMETMLIALVVAILVVVGLGAVWKKMSG
jgi:uncharacterized membrane protein